MEGGKSFLPFLLSRLISCGRSNVMPNTISILAARVVQEARAQTSIAQNQGKLTEPAKDDSSSQAEKSTVAEALAPDSASSQSALATLAPALNVPVEGRISEALGLAGEFQSSFSIIHPTLAALELSIVANQSGSVYFPNQINVSQQFVQGLRQFASIFGGQDMPYASVTPDPIILALGDSEDTPLIDVLL